MQDESKRNSALVEAFISGFLDKRILPYKSIKESHSLCRKAVETSLRQNPDMNNIILTQDWIKELIVNNALLRLNFYGLLEEMKTSGKDKRKFEETTARKSFW